MAKLEMIRAGQDDGVLSLGCRLRLLALVLFAVGAAFAAADGWRTVGREGLHDTARLEAAASVSNQTLLAKTSFVWRGINVQRKDGRSRALPKVALRLDARSMPRPDAVIEVSALASAPFVSPHRRTTNPRAPPRA